MNNPLTDMDPMGLRTISSTAGSIARGAGRRTIPGIAIDIVVTIGKTIVNFCQGKSGDGDDCDRRYRQMEELADDLSRKYHQFKADAGGLPETKPTVPDARYGLRSRRGEAQSFYQQQGRLRRLIAEAILAGCTNIPARAAVWAGYNKHLGPNYPNIWPSRTQWKYDGS